MIAVYAEQPAIFLVWIYSLIFVSFCSHCVKTGLEKLVSRVWILSFVPRKSFPNLAKREREGRITRERERESERKESREDQEKKVQRKRRGRVVNGPEMGLILCMSFVISPSSSSRRNKRSNQKKKNVTGVSPQWNWEKFENNLEYGTPMIEKNKQKTMESANKNVGIN